MQSNMEHRLRSTREENMEAYEKSALNGHTHRESMAEDILIIGLYTWVIIQGYEALEWVTHMLLLSELLHLRKRN